MADAATNQTPDLARVKEWVISMGDKGIYQATSARLRATAIDQLTSVLAEDEPKDPRWVLDNIETITMRWATKNDAKRDTATTYRTRAKGALEDFFNFMANPLTFKPRVRAVAAEPAKRTDRKAAKVEEDTEAEEAIDKAPSAAPPPPVTNLRSYPLPDGAEFKFILPDRGVTTKDVQRIAWHLATMATDFDPFQTTARNPLAKRDDD